MTADLIQAHWNLERKLRIVLLESSPENRWEVAERAYQDLYTLLRWHNEACPPAATIRQSFSTWTAVVGSAPQAIYEIGSGRGALLRALTDLGHTCRGTEITRERGQTYLADDSRITWGNTDGIHLDQFEPANRYDVVISNQVIEHLHPDDVQTHFASAFRLLRAGGRYICSTPHRLTGPHDLCLVFDLENAEGMHLKEYTWGELTRIARQSGFSHVHAATTSRLTGSGGPWSSAIGRIYLNGMICLERLLASIPSRRVQQKLSRYLRKARIFSDNIHVVCTKTK